MARLTPDRIVSAAIEVIGEVGFEQFSVRTLGDALDADPTAIYRHFRSKDALLRAMGDRGLAGLTDNLPISSWRDCIRELCVRIRAANLARPALASLGRVAPPRHRNESLITETMLSQLHAAGFDTATAAQAYHALIELTIGSAYAALDAAAFPFSVETAASLYPGTADERFAFALDRLLDGLAAQLAPSHGEL